MKLKINNTFNNELPADPILDNSPRQVENACFSYVNPKKTGNPQILHVSNVMLENLGLSDEDSKSKEFLNVFTGNSVLKDTKPYSMCYGGHQFGNWAGQLGDGRAINLTEVVHNNNRWAIQLKGAGPTPYSRTSDGLAVLRSSIREYLCSEAMYNLGVPTTRALTLAITGDQVMRDVMYDGHPAYEKGAVVCRVANTFVRFGNFEILAAREEDKNLKLLADYTLKHFYSEIKTKGKQKYIDLFEQVTTRSMEMVIQWQRIGFVHGVMNTDNMSIIGDTIDYGPYGWLEGYESGWTPNTTDKQNKRYRFGNQPNIVLWNLIRLANALYPLIEETKPLESILESFKENYELAYFRMMKTKLGLFEIEDEDAILITSIQQVLESIKTDMTLFYRLLSRVMGSDNSKQALKKINNSFYNIVELEGKVLDEWLQWFTLYLARLSKESISDREREKKMNRINPKYVLRNYMAQLAIDEANKGNYDLINELYLLLLKPYDEQPKMEKWFAKRPNWAKHKVGCSMLSCSS